jgi:SprT-like family
VVDSEYRLLNTLVHEMCHAATWLIDNVSKPPHGTQFKVNIVNNSILFSITLLQHYFDHTTLISAVMYVPMCVQPHALSRV